MCGRIGMVQGSIRDSSASIPAARYSSTLARTTAPNCQRQLRRVTWTIPRASAETTYYLNRPGKVTVYFIDRDDHVSVVGIVVTSASPPSATPGWGLIFLGVLACGFGIVFWYRRIGGHVPDDLKRADEASRSGSYDPEKAQRAAWDALDQSSGQY